jgi:hypothetical protein
MTKEILNLIFELGFEYDRMSEQGKEIYDKLWEESGADKAWIMWEQDNEHE